MRKILACFLICIFIACFSVNASAYRYTWGDGNYWDISDPDHLELLENGYYVNDSYDLIFDFADPDDMRVDDRCWWYSDIDEKNKKIKLIFSEAGVVEGGIETPSINDLTVRIPNTVNGYTVTSFYICSGGFKAFDVDPDNPYFKSDGQTVFSKDGKKLIAYAQYDDSTEYIVPKGTHIIGEYAFFNCDNLKKITISADVEEIEDYAFWGCNSVEELVFEDFSFSIGKNALDSVVNDADHPVLPTSPQTTKVSAKGNVLKWNAVQNASYYELYQKLKNGEYKLLKTVNGTSCKMLSMKSGNSYTFAVKPIANIKIDENNSFKINKIEGTMSEDIVVTGV